MIVLIDKTFDKDINKINYKSILKKVATCITDIQDANSLSEIKNLKKLKYRIKIGEYKIGLIIENRKITFVRFREIPDSAFNADVNA